MVLDNIVARALINHCFLHLSIAGMVFLLLFESNDVVAKDASSYTTWQSQLLDWWAYEGSAFTPAAAVGRIGHGIVLLPPSFCIEDKKLGDYYYPDVTTCDRITKLENRRGTVQSVGFIVATVVLMVICCVILFLKQQRKQCNKKGSNNSKCKTTESKGHNHHVQAPVDIGTQKSCSKTKLKMEEDRAISMEAKLAPETGTSEARSSTSSSPSFTAQRAYNLRYRQKKGTYKE